MWSGHYRRALARFPDMYFVALAADYDGTLADHGKVDDRTIDAIKKVKETGRKLILITGRALPELTRDFQHLDVFDLAVLENGALLFDPSTKEEISLAKPPSAEFVERLQKLGVSPLSVGRTIVATWEPNETLVLEAIRDLGLDLQIIFNKGAVMVLPSSVNKASGLKAALERLKLSAHNVVGIGDAENDHAFLKMCGCSAAVDNAIPAIKKTADIQVPARGAGVIVLSQQLIETDFRSPSLGIPRSRPMLGKRVKTETPVHIAPFETTLVTGSSGGGKSTTVTALLEQIRSLAYQFCVIDPEGDYGEFEGAAIVGDSKHPPGVEEVMSLLEKPDVSVVVNLLAIEPDDRPGFLTKFLPELTKLRAATGRPHWIVIDEAHHCLPATMGSAAFTLPKELPAAIAVTVHPESVSPDFLKLVTTVIGVGEGSRDAIAKFCGATKRNCPLGHTAPLEKGQVHILDSDGRLDVVNANRPEGKKKRHARKYAEGELGEDRSFYFRGSTNALNLRAQNLQIFLQLAAGVDDDTWLHHLRAGEYSKWFRDAIKDETLAEEAQAIERTDQNAKSSRAAIKEMVDKRYTAPAKG
jgi:hydroxymethylpyrimidine pyrophosphatase-like HAD family hydrolase